MDHRQASNTCFSFLRQNHLLISKSFIKPQTSSLLQNLPIPAGYSYSLPRVINTQEAASTLGLEEVSQEKPISWISLRVFITSICDSFTASLTLYFLPLLVHLVSWAQLLYLAPRAAVQQFGLLQPVTYQQWFAGLVWSLVFCSSGDRCNMKDRGFSFKAQLNTHQWALSNSLYPRPSVFSSLNGVIKRQVSLTGYCESEEGSSGRMYMKAICKYSGPQSCEFFFFPSFLPCLLRSCSH